MKEVSNVASCKFNHTPVLASELIELLKNLPSNLLEEGFLLDTTVGGGGHSALMLDAFPKLNLLGLDQDPNSIKAATQHLMRFRRRVQLNQINFANFIPSAKVSVVLSDLGVSSPQLDEGTRGFSFQLDGPLDMRMNPLEGISAAELINKLQEKELANLIYQFGEEKFSRRIARRIKNDLVTQGPYSGTKALANAIYSCYPKKFRHGRIHPATKTFQALRIRTNNELDALSSLLKNAPDWILPDGLFAVISFHSLEDRLIKHAFVNDERLERITKKPITASSKELSANHRSRSAKLRVARKN